MPARVPKTKIVWDFYFLFLNIKRKKQITMNFFIFFDEIHGNRKKKKVTSYVAGLPHNALIIIIFFRII